MVWNSKYHNFYGPWCDIGPVPPGPPSPGPFAPTKLQNCSWAEGMGIHPPKVFKRVVATSQLQCCELCGEEATCVNAVFQCYPGHCTCNLHVFAAEAQLHPQANSTTCLTGRQPISYGGALSEEELLN